MSWPPDDLPEFMARDSFLEELLSVQERLSIRWPLWAAQDAVFEATSKLMIRALEDRHFVEKFKSQQALVGYISSASRNLIVDRLRRSAQPIDLASIEDEEENEDVTVLEFVLDGEIEVGLSQLELQILHLRFREGQTLATVAKRTGLSTSSIHRKQERALTLLREYLQL